MGDGEPCDEESEFCGSPVFAGGALPGPGVVLVVVVVGVVVEPEESGGVVTGASAGGGEDVVVVVVVVDAVMLVGWLGASTVGSLCVCVRPGGVAVPVADAVVVALVVVVVVELVFGVALAADALTAVDAISVPLWPPADLCVLVTRLALGSATGWTAERQAVTTCVVVGAA